MEQEPDRSCGASEVGPYAADLHVVRPAGAPLCQKVCHLSVGLGPMTVATRVAYGRSQAQSEVGAWVEKYRVTRIPRLLLSPASTPRWLVRALVHLTEGPLWPLSDTALSAVGTHELRGRTQRPARSRGFADAVPPLAQAALLAGGLSPRQAGLPPQDDNSGFQSAIADLHSLRRAWPGRTISPFARSSA